MKLLVAAEVDLGMVPSVELAIRSDRARCRGGSCSRLRGRADEVGETAETRLEEPVKPATPPRHYPRHPATLTGRAICRGHDFCDFSNRRNRARCRGTPTMPGHADDAGARLPTIPSISIGSHRNPSGFIRISSILAYENGGTPPPPILTLFCRKVPRFRPADQQIVAMACTTCL